MKQSAKAPRKNPNQYRATLELTFPIKDRTHVRNMRDFIRNPHISLYEHYPFTSVPSDWYHPFNLRWNKTTDHARGRRLKRSIEDYFYHALGEVHPHEILTSEFIDHKARFKNTRDIFHIKNAIRECNKSIDAIFNQAVITDLIIQIMDANPPHAERITKIYINEYFQRQYKKFIENNKNAATEIKIRKAKKLENIINPGKYPESEISLPKEVDTLSRQTADQALRHAYALKQTNIGTVE